MNRQGAASVLGALLLCALCGGRASADDPYDRDPGHAWNRLHQELFVWEDPSAVSPSWSSHFLTKESHKRIVAALDKFIADKAIGKISDPVKRLLLQRDLWAVIDLIHRTAADPDPFEAERRALRDRLARVIGEVALTEEETLKLPDNYAKAVASRKYPEEYSGSPDPFLPKDLFDDKGPWVRVGGEPPLAVAHNESVGSRSLFHVFLRVPAGRDATLAFLKDLNSNHRVFPVDAVLPKGTMVALAHRILAIDKQGKIRATPIVEGLQVRVNHADGPGHQHSNEFRLNRRSLFEGHAGGLIAVGSAEEAIPLLGKSDLASTHGLPRQERIGILANCVSCHHKAETSQILSLRRLSPVSHAKDREPLKTLPLDAEVEVTIKAKQQRDDWKALQATLDALRNR